MVAHILVANDCDHRPLHRQSVLDERVGVELAGSVMVGEMAWLLDPLVEAISPHV